MAASFDDDADSKSILSKLDSIAPIREFDAFPKVASTYTTRSSLGGIATLLVIGLAFLLSLNDIGEFLWGWPDFEYSLDRRLKSTLEINLDMVVNMPCGYVSIDVRDAVGDRLQLSKTFHRDGTTFDVSQAHNLQSHGDTQSTSEIVTAAKKKSGGVFAALKSQSSSYRPTYNHVPAMDACRIYGTVEVKRVTGNLHITTLGHGYASHEHTDHKLINLTHVITELSFGPYFPNIAQPLDYSFEATDDPFTLFQYFITVVPTIYRAPRSSPLRTNQYSVTSYRRTLQHGRGTPGIFFKYDIDPIEMTVWQRTTSFSQFFLRLCGVIGGVWVCASWALKVGTKAAWVVAGKDKEDGHIVNEAALRRKASNSAKKAWNGGELRARTTMGNGTGNGWTIDGGASPYSATFSPMTPNPSSGFPPITPTSAMNGFPPTTPNGSGLPPPSPFGAGPYTPSTPSRYAPPSPAPYANGGSPPQAAPRPKSNLGPGGDKRAD